MKPHLFFRSIRPFGLILTLAALSACKFITGSGGQASDGGTQQAEQCLKLASSEASVCDDFEAYQCSQVIYSPDLKSTSFQQQECTLLDQRQACLNVDVEVNDTSALIANASEAASAKGGDLNRSQYTCAVRSRDGWLRAELIAL